MDESVRKEIGELFIDTGNKIIAGNCVWNDEQMIEACNLIGHIIQQMHRVFKNMIGTGIK